MTRDQFKEIKDHAIIARQMLRPGTGGQFKTRLVFEHLVRDFVLCVEELDKTFGATAVALPMNGDEEN